MTINFIGIESEQLNFIRKSITDPNNRTINHTNTLAGDGSTTLFSLTGIASGSHLQHINTVTVGGVTQKWGKDYLGIVGGVSKDKIQFTSAPGASVVIVVDFNYGSKDIAYNEFPRVNLPLSEYPRISVAYLYPTKIVGMRDVLSTDIRITIVVLSENNYELNTILKELRDAYVDKFKSSDKEFYYIRIATPTNVAEISMSEDVTKDVVGKAFELLCPHNYEM